MRPHLFRSAALVPLLWGASALLAAQQPAAPIPGASHSDVAVSFRFGTPGFGLQVGKLLTGHVAARVGVNYFKISTTKSQSSISYDASLKLHAVPLLIDFYPGERGSFHVTGGIVTNPLTISGTGQAAAGTFKINGNSYPAATVGTLSVEGKFPGVSPYLGLGFGTPASSGGALQFLFDLGAAIGKPTISLSASAPTCAPGTPCGNDLQAQQATTQHDVRKYLRVYPVLAFGLGYRW